MKKILFITLILLMALPLFAKNQIAVGLEAGYPASGINITYSVDNKFDVYGVLSYKYSKAVQVVLGGSFLVDKMDIGTGMPIRVGFQIIPSYSFVSNNFSACALATVSGSYNITENLETYLRTGAGLAFIFNENFKLGFNFSAALGLSYRF